MNKRSLLVIIAFAVPVLGLATYSYMHPKAPARVQTAAPKRQAYPPLPEVQARIKARMDELNAMTPEQWEEQKKKNPRITITLDVARAGTKKAYENLASMTPEEWDRRHQPNQQARPNQPRPQGGLNASRPAGQTPAPAGAAKPADPYYPPPAR